MLTDPLFIIPAIAALVVAAVLVAGLASFTKGGDFNRRNGNRLMRWRLIAQFIAVVIIVAFAWYRASNS